MFNRYIVKIALCFFAVCSTSVTLDATYFTTPPYSPEEVQLHDNLAGTLEKLSREAIAIGDPINAFMVEIQSDEIQSVSTHIGHYFGAKIRTYVAKDINYDPHVSKNPGFQEISFLNPSDISRSNSWVVETVDTTDYIVHDHGTFLVYSNATEQYVVSK